MKLFVHNDFTVEFVPIIKKPQHEGENGKVLQN